ETEMAVSVDDVFHVRSVIPSDIMPADISACEGMEEFVKGLIRLRVGSEEKDEVFLLLYLNLHKMLTDLLRGKIARPAPDFYVWRWESGAVRS
ncbi:MAG TPA: hypothetical protein PK024_10335, partial [Methanospirillum sp.]|uniref:hypothetical protein n=1 Tax=Methanospirillum sp. TaxID=45200 RepID=UPI002C63E5D8